MIKSIIQECYNMNKFQKIAVQMAKDDKNKAVDVFKNEPLKIGSRHYYLMFKNNKKTYSYQRALAFKNWSKKQAFQKNLFKDILNKQ